MRFFLCVALATMTLDGFASECVVRSGARTNTLVELYTSEGCDSCPPADRWLSGFAKDPAAAQGLVPIAFHVDYWDDLGWKDRFGDGRYSERQRVLARSSGARAVYTPQVVLAGRDFPAWRSGKFTSASASVMAAPARATLEIDPRGGAAPVVRILAKLAAGEPTGDLALFVAVTQNGLSSRVSAGENKGATLHHDFVVRDFRKVQGWSAGDSTLATTAELSPRPDWKLADMAVVAFVQNTRTGAVLQALSAPFCRKPGSDHH